MGHRQQIKYRVCLLGGTFSYSEMPFYLCLAAVHTQTQMQQQGNALEEPRTEQGPKTTYPDEAAFSC